VIVFFAVWAELINSVPGGSIYNINMLQDIPCAICLAVIPQRYARRQEDKARYRMLTASEFLVKNVLAPLRMAERRLTTTNGSISNDGDDSSNDNNKDQSSGSSDFVLHDVMWACEIAIEALEHIRDALDSDEEIGLHMIDSDSAHSNHSNASAGERDAGAREREREWEREGRQREGAITAPGDNESSVDRNKLRKLIIKNLSQEFIHNKKSFQLDDRTRDRDRERDREREREREREHGRQIRRPTQQTGFHSSSDPPPQLSGITDELKCVPSAPGSGSHSRSAALPHAIDIDMGFHAHSESGVLSGADLGTMSSESADKRNEADAQSTSILFD